MSGVRFARAEGPLLALAIAGAVWATTPTTDVAGGLESDGIYYAALAGAPDLDASLSRVAPWCWRVLTPWLASLLPWPVVTSFRVLAFVSTWATMALLSFVLRRCGFDRGLCRLGLLLYGGVFWAVKFAAYSPAYVDHQAQLAVMGTLALAVAGRFWAIPMVLTVAVLQKETTLLAAAFPVAAFARAHGVLTVRSLAYLAACLLPPALTLAALRAAMPAELGHTALAQIAGNLPRLGTPEMWPRLGHALLSGLGLLPVAIAAAPQAARDFLRRRPEWGWFAAAGALPLLASTDKSRLLLGVLPAAVVLALRALERTRASAGRPLRGWLAATVAVHLFLGGHLAPLGPHAEYLRRFVPEHAPGAHLGALGWAAALATGWLVATLWMRRRAWACPPRQAAGASGYHLPRRSPT